MYKISKSASLLFDLPADRNLGIPGLSDKLKTLKQKIGVSQRSDGRRILGCMKIVFLEYHLVTPAEYLVE